MTWVYDPVTCSPAWGGGILADRLLGHETVFAVEISAWRQRILIQRQQDGCIPAFPIWDDVRTFDGRPWRGSLDVLCAGIPCPKWSGARRGRGDPPDFIDETLRIVRESLPPFVFIECVRNIKRETARLRAAFADIDYDLGEPLVVSTTCVGAPYARPRCWFLASSDQYGESTLPIDGEVAGLPALPDDPRCAWWSVDPARVLRVPARMAHRVERLAAAGDGQVPALAALAWHRLRRAATPRRQ